MNYRIASILAAENATTPATRTLDINIKKPISRITIQFKALNADSAPDGHPAKMVTKIELVDGSNVLFGLSGIEAQALNVYETGRMPMTALNFIAAGYAIASFEINFGRQLWDEQLAFDPAKFNNPQLKITHNLANGGSSTSAAELSVFAHTFDQKAITPVGFLMSKELYSYTLAVNAKEHIDIATDFPHRALMIQSLYTGKQPWENVHQLKLTEDNDAVVVINDELTSDIIKLAAHMPRITEELLAYDLDGSPTLFCTPSMWTSISGLGIGTFNGSLYTTQSMGGTFVATGDNMESAQFIINGILPHGALHLPFGKQDVVEDWYDATKIGSLKLIVTAGSAAAGTCQVVSQQYKKY